MFELVDYLTESGHDPLKQWLEKLADRQARARILVRLQRMSAGNVGDCKHLRDGVWELRIDYGPGYKVYYARAGDKLLLLLIAGDKRRQHADITTALSYWKDWKRRNPS